MAKTLSPEGQRSRAAGREKIWNNCVPYGEPCGMCRACMLKRWMAEGVVDPHKRFNNWQPAHDTLIRSLAGTRTGVEIAGILSQRFEISRTGAAVHQHAAKLGIDLRLSTYTSSMVAWLFGVHRNILVYRWIPSGLLHSEHRPTYRTRSAPMGTAKRVHTIMDNDIEAFIRQCPEAYDYRAMRPGRFRSLAEVIQRSDPPLVNEQITQALGYDFKALRLATRAGTLQSPRLRWGYGYANRHGTLVVRRSLLPKLLAEAQAIGLIAA